MKWIEWVNNVRSDAKAAYALALVEKYMIEIEKYDWFMMVRKAIDMCWKWVEEKQYSGDDLYETVDNEEEDGLIYIEGLSFVGDDAYGPQAELIWSCAVDAVLYTARQAYEMKGEAFPQPVGINDDEFMDEEFNQKIKKVNGYNSFAKEGYHSIQCQPAGAALGHAARCGVCRQAVARPQWRIRHCLV